jgi:predicted polyphosphate/ATP-dependent NAD kinase
MITSVGIIANPASGKDIRRLVAYGSVFDNQEKINILSRVLRGLEAFGIQKVFGLADPYELVIQAYEKAKTKVLLELSDIPLENSAQDSLNAARWMNKNGVGCIVTLGGDGTNRAIAKGCEDTPLLPLSTGTNNVFSQDIEGTLAGIAAAAVSLGLEGVELTIRATRCLAIYQNGHKIDLALVDVVVYADWHKGSGAIWEPEKIKQVILAEIHPAAIGAAAIANSLDYTSKQQNLGVSIEVGGDTNYVIAPIAPGIILPVPVKSVKWLAIGDKIPIETHDAALALDGERDLIINPQDYFEVQICNTGPRVVLVGPVLEIARLNHLFDWPKEVKIA